MKHLSSALLHVNLTDTTPRCGATLIANPLTAAGHANRSLITIIDYLDTEGTTGVTLNRPTGDYLSDLVPGIDPASRIPVFCGGPEGQDRIFFIHSLGTEIMPGSRPYAPGLWVGGDFSTIKSYINSGYPVEGFVRFFTGYHCWGEGELEKELEDGKWAMSEMTSPAHNLSGIGDKAWFEAVKRQEDRLRPWAMIPRHPDFN